LLYTLLHPLLGGDVVVEFLSVAPTPRLAKTQDDIQEAPPAKQTKKSHSDSCCFSQVPESRSRGLSAPFDGTTGRNLGLKPTP
jgi:hypothetical protein